MKREETQKKAAELAETTINTLTTANEDLKKATKEDLEAQRAEKAAEKKRAEKAAEKKKAEKEAKAKKLKEQQEDKVKRSVVSGDSASELIKNIREVDWDKVAEEVRPRTGGKFNFGV